MIIRDMMPGFELYQPKSIEDAVALLDKHGKDSWRLAGGNDLLSWFKDRAKKPKVVVDLTAIPALRGIKETADGVEIGALTSLTEIERHPGIRQKFRTLAEAAAKVASPQIRNSGTLGGNVAQDARCWYYRAGMPCYRAGGNTCYADTPEGMNREHALFEADRCVAVTPSDINPVLVALEAKMVVRNAKGERVINAEDFFIGPRVDITRMTAMDTKDLLVAIRVPNTWAGAKLYFEKVADRESWDFPLVNIASAMVVRDGVVQQARIVCGGVQCTPRRLRVAEDVVKGKTPSPDVAKLAGQSVTRGARPLNYNHFKVPLMANLVARAVRNST